MKSVRLPAGRRLRLQCRVRGVPLPRVSWYHNGRPVNASRRIRFRTKKKKRRLQSFLIIRRVLPGDAGSYQCRAKNRAGESSKRARVAVFQRRVRPPPTPKPTGPDKPKPPDSWRAAEACDIPSYCLNGGSCTLYRSVMEYVCQCAEGFKGKRCERKTVYAIKQRPDEPLLKAGQFQPLVLVLGGLSVLLLLLLLIAVLWRRRSRPRGRAQCRNGAVAMATGNGTVAMATDEASKPAEAAPTSMRRPPQLPAGRSEQVPAATPVSRPSDLSPPPSPPSETTKLSSSSSTDLRRAPPAGSDVARDGAVSLPTQKSVKELDVLLQTLDLVTGPDESIPKRLA
ncbi:pro-neuregulin-2, membrane-bound isoform-like [Amphibalanus amphitrite]|uniref:pro-neuregulin-2, membrane-bound isoform-like n=1 Tax=Amphibalanus amphitrite TaxID=1232801 RepID=UPI001C8FBF06|nr:pro-neuregulin-2, membrane-bound isoform-like [Amphibalanus amphitrite]